jgi:hypothetical protein
MACRRGNTRSMQRSMESGGKMDAEGGSNMFLQKCRLTSARLRGMISQKLKLFTVSNVRTLNATMQFKIGHCSVDCSYVKS